MNVRRWLASLAAVALLVTGAVLLWPVGILAEEDSQSDLEAETRLSRGEAERIALEEFPGATVRETELERENGIIVYSIELSTGAEVEVHGDDGTILEIELADDDPDDADDDD